MNLQQIAGVLLVLGILLFTVGIFMGSRGLNAAQSDEARIEIINANRTQISVYSLIFEVGTIAITTGFVLFALHLWPQPSKLLLLLGSGAFILAAVFATVYVYRGLGDTRQYIENYYAGSLWISYTVASSVAGILFGIVLVQSGFQPLLGYFTVGASALLLVYAALPSIYTYGIFLVYYAVILVIGVVLLRS